MRKIAWDACIKSHAFLRTRSERSYWITCVSFIFFDACVNRMRLFATKKSQRILSECTLKRTKLSSIRPSCFFPTLFCMCLLTVSVLSDDDWRDSNHYLFFAHFSFNIYFQNNDFCFYINKIWSIFVFLHFLFAFQVFSVFYLFLFFGLIS